MQDRDWNDLAVVLAVYRGSTFAKAARFLGVNQSTVTRRLEACEKRLKARLFERVPGRLVPTAHGRELIARAEQIEPMVDGAFGAVLRSDQAVAGTVRVTAVPILVNHLLIPALPELSGEHPDLRVELVAEPRDLSLRKREADIAVRLARPVREQGMTTSKIGVLAYGAYQPRGFDAGDLPWIGYEDSMSDLPNSRWIERQARRHQGQMSQLTVNDATGLIAALQAGLGRSVLPRSVAAGLQDLEPVSTDDEPPSREVWMLIHPDLKHLARIQTVNGWLRRTVQAATLE
ncbi:MAG: LysR family transcriptional regulator [Pseudomonadota bacterium]